MNKAKELILHWATHDRTFQAGMKLFVELGKNIALKNRFNLQGETQKNAEMLHYHLGKLAGIAEADWRKILKQPIVEIARQEDLPVLTYEEQLTAIPVEVKSAMRLREDFPFLKEKTCPDALKILVADMLSAHDNYVTAHERLFSAITAEDQARLSSEVVDNYIENRQIWDELVHYREHGKPLGEHPVWQRAQRLQELQELSPGELTKLSRNIPTNISRIKKKLQENPDSPETANRQISLERYEWELAEVKKLLNID